MEIEPSCPQCVIITHLLRELGDQQLHFCIDTSYAENLSANSRRRISLYTNAVQVPADKSTRSYSSAKETPRSAGSLGRCQAFLECYDRYADAITYSANQQTHLVDHAQSTAIGETAE